MKWVANDGSITMPAIVVLLATYFLIGILVGYTVGQRLETSKIIFDGDFLIYEYVLHERVVKDEMSSN